jgi:hypothetical protein
MSKAKRVITVGKHLQAVVIENLGVTPVSNIRLSGGMTMTLKEYVKSCNGVQIHVEFGNDASQQIWKIILKCFEFEESLFTDQTSKFKIHVHMMTNDTSNPENIYNFLKTKLENTLNIYDLPRDKLEFYVPFFRYEMFGNLSCLVLDDIVYSNEPQFIDDFQKVYMMEQRNKATNLFYSRFFQYYERVQSQIIVEDKLNVLQSDLTRSIEILTLKKHKISKDISTKESEILKNHYANKRALNQDILQHNHDLIKVNDDLAILKAGIEGFEPVSKLKSSASVIINYPISIDVLDSFKDVYRKIRFNKSLKISLEKGDFIKLSNQKKAGLNGNYVVEIGQPLVVAENIPSLSFYASFKIIKINKDNVEKLFYNDFKNTIIATSDTNFPFDIVWFSDLKEKGHLIKTANHKTIAIIHNGLRETRRENEHICFQDKNILSMEVCENKGLNWDRMCTSNFDCPFYNDKNGRGGCFGNGYCEMPIGAKQQGFTKFTNKNGIYCHGCSKETVPHCCTKISEESGWPAFAGDERPLFESFANDDNVEGLMMYLRLMSNEVDVSLEGWINASPDIYLVNLAGKTILGNTYSLFRAYPIESKFYKSPKATKEVFFSSVAIIKGGKVISFDTLYQPITNNMVFSKVNYLGNVGTDTLAFQSYKDVFAQLSSLYPSSGSSLSLTS